MKFEEALKHLREGKRIRRAGWVPDWHLGDSRYVYDHELLSDDWEIYEKKVEITREQLIEAVVEVASRYKYITPYKIVGEDVADKLGL